MGKNKEQQIEQMDGTYSFGDLDDSWQFTGGASTDTFSVGLDYDIEWSAEKEEETLQEKYPALKQAWDHYQSVLQLCKSKESEE